MTQVDFYILEQSERLNFLCRLIEKIYSKGHKIYIHTEEQTLAEQLDKGLWTFRPDSFIPHAIANDNNSDEKVLIGVNQEPSHHHDVMINLGKEVPLHFSRFERVAEIISANEQERQYGRQRYSFYRDRGYTLNSHKI